MVKESPNAPLAAAAGSDEWFLEVEGKKTGPYTAEQVEGLFREGEILGQARVTTDELAGRWVSVESLVSWLQSTRAQAQPGREGTFTPPPRPTEIGGISAAPGAHPHEAAAADPMHGLFDALRTSRERLNAQRPPSPLPPMASTHGSPGGGLTSTFEHRLAAFRALRLPSQLYLIAGMSAVLAFGVWGLVKLLDRGQPGAGNTPVAVQDPETAPAQAPRMPAAAPVAPAPPAPAPISNFRRAPAPPVSRVQPAAQVQSSIRQAPPRSYEPRPQDPESPPAQDTLETDRELAGVPVGDSRATSGGAPTDDLRSEEPEQPAPDGLVNQVLDERGLMADPEAVDPAAPPPPEQPQDLNQ